MVHKRDEQPRNHRGYPDKGKVVKDEFHDIAKLGGEILKRTMVSGLGVIKDVKEGLPKEASQILSKGKEELIKSLASKELLQDLVATAIDRAFARVRDHRLEISIRIARADTEKSSKKHED